MKSKKTVLVIGSAGQLGNTLFNQSKNISDIEWRFLNSTELDITNQNNLKQFFSSNTFDYCINCAAYTNVDQAEDEPYKAMEVNCNGVKNIIDLIRDKPTTIIHISTDYVFNGEKNSAYKEEDIPNPINVYGQSKLAGEKVICENIDTYYIIRTSWLYSNHGKNFVQTIKNRIKKGDKLHVSSSQNGSPTSASSLSNAIVHLIRNDKKKYGIFHFSNRGLTNWYIFAKKIIELIDSEKMNQLFEIEKYKTKALRPKNSKLDSSKFEKEFNFSINNWEDELKKELSN